MNPDWDDLDAFIELGDFGVSATLTLQTGGTRNIVALFDDPAEGMRYNQRNPMAPASKLGDYDMDADSPRITAKVSDLAGVRRGDGATIGGKQYGILSTSKPDGNGFAVVPLVLES